MSCRSRALVRTRLKAFFFFAASHKKIPRMAVNPTSRACAFKTTRKSTAAKEVFNAWRPSGYRNIVFLLPPLKRWPVFAPTHVWTKEEEEKETAFHLALLNSQPVPSAAAAAAAWFLIDKGLACSTNPNDLASH